MLTPQTEIKGIMLKHGISYRWIADRLNSYPQKVEYTIEMRKEIPLSDYMAIMQLFEKHGYIEDSIQKCNDLIELSFRSNAKLGDTLKKMNEQIAEDIRDHKFTPEERLKMRVRIEDMRKEFNEMFEQLQRLTYAEE